MRGKRSIVIISPRATALVIDDDDAGREMLSAMLESLGYIVKNAPDGRAGLDRLDGHIDVVLLDVNMPGMNGFEVASVIRGGPHKNVPIILTTALDTRATPESNHAGDAFSGTGLPSISPASRISSRKGMSGPPRR